MKSANSLIQYFLLALVVIFYAINGFAFAAFYGAAISLSNTLIFNWYTDKQEALVDADAQKSFRMAINSSVVRALSLILLAIVGLGFLELDPAALCLSMVVGQVGFILDRLRQK
ncbi:ATP synthase subunit I [Candidatus Pseudothioglobus singularis]|uniref:ATP synthase subunit I n=1 Tax=Candidatus Pseudothioglobus singularis TaxID=1427364 RepID=UPI001F474C12|nr:ATP synthase subunit I [Candidatus Pseudothioglobus singularis]